MGRFVVFRLPKGSWRCRWFGHIYKQDTWHAYRPDIGGRSMDVAWCQRCGQIFEPHPAGKAE